MPEPTTVILCFLLATVSDILRVGFCLFARVIDVRPKLKIADEALEE